jgi:hypothetical protein
MSRMSRVRRPFSLLALLVAAALSACENPFSNDGESLIRLKNASTFELTSVTFSPGSPRLEFPRIAPGATTEYASVRGAYSYGYLDVLVGGQHRVIQPIDYVGEDVIGEGRFTYVITIDAASRNPSVAMVKDD